MSNNTYRVIPQNSSHYSHYGCYTVPPDIGGRGVTTWAHSNGTSYTLSPNQSKTITFTCTKPECYKEQDWCNVHFKATPKNTATDTTLNFIVKGPTSTEDHTQEMWLSGVTNHEIWQTYELANIGGTAYKDTELNTIVLANPSSSTIEISGFRIIRAYEMLNNYNAYCNPAVNTGAFGNLDSTRNDYPCRLNSPSCGERSVNETKDNIGNFTIPAGDSVEWVFDWTNYTSANYLTKDVTLFNFNEMTATTDNNVESDVELTAYINGSTLTTFYLSKLMDHSAFPSYDLTLNSAYNDKGVNTVKLVNNSSVPVRFKDGYGINIYRVYKSASICPSTCGNCVMCYNCYLCYAWYLSCQAGCESSCLDCQVGCELGCQGCEGCQNSCEFSCQNCQVCEGCQACISCQGSELCPGGYTCNWCESCQPYQTPEKTSPTKDTKLTNQPTQKTETTNQIPQPNPNPQILPKDQGPTPNQVPHLTPPIQTVSQESVREVVLETLIELDLLPKAQKKQVIKIE